MKKVNNKKPSFLFIGRNSAEGIFSKKNKKLLFDNYCLFLKEALKTGKNKSKKSHSPYAVEFLSKKTKQKLNQPEY